MLVRRRQVAHLAHLNARDTTLVYASRAPQPDIARLKARMEWEMPWYTITDSFDKDFGVDQWHGHNVFFRKGDKIFRTYFVNNRGDEALGSTLELPGHYSARPAETWWVWRKRLSAKSEPYKWWNWHDNYAEASTDPKWLDMLSDPEGAAERRAQEEKKSLRLIVGTTPRLLAGSPHVFPGTPIS